MAVPVVESHYGAFTKNVSDGYVTVTKPSGVVAGDMLVIIVGHSNNNENRHFTAITSESGWTLRSAPDGGATDVWFGVYTKIATGSDAATVQCPATNMGTVDTIGFYIRISGADDVDIVGTELVQTSDTTSFVIPGVTTTVDDCLVLYGLMCDTQVAPFSVGGSWTEQNDIETDRAGNGMAGCWGTLEKATAGATGDCTVTSTDSDAGCGVLIALAPAAGGDVTASPGAATVTTTGLTPTLNQTANYFIDAGAGVLTTTGLTPAAAVSANITVSPGPDSLSTTDLLFGPTLILTENHFANPAATPIAVTGLQPATSASASVKAQPAAGSLTATGLSPTTDQSLNHFADPAAVALVATGLAVTLDQTANHFSDPAASNLTAKTLTATLSQTANHFSDPAVVALTTTGLAPTPDQTFNHFAAPVVADLAATGLVPVADASANETVQPGVAALAITPVAPTLDQTANQWIAPGAGTATVTGLVPTVDTPLATFIQTGVGSLAFKGLWPNAPLIEYLVLWSKLSTTTSVQNDITTVMSALSTIVDVNSVYSSQVTRSQPTSVLNALASVASLSDTIITSHSVQASFQKPLAVPAVYSGMESGISVYQELSL